MQMENLLGHKKIATRAWRKANWAVDGGRREWLCLESKYFLTSGSQMSYVCQGTGIWIGIGELWRTRNAKCSSQLLLDMHTHTRSRWSCQKKNETPLGDGEIFDIRARIQLTIIAWQLTRPREWVTGRSPDISVQLPTC